ncbi:MAG: type II toxin-antitoxin system RelE/ParE family toxin [Peptostreptococcaceae bacterium]|nr:type II toxin-antitoxin system RelE/ParE family toxin [Peptostreptococcaceae bacterium]
MGSTSIEITSKAEHAFIKLQKKDGILLAEIMKKIEMLEKGKPEALDIRPIIRKNGDYKINEIRIKHPNSYRLFYIQVYQNEDKIIIVDGRKKKVGKFPLKYFKELDKCINTYLGC